MTASPFLESRFPVGSSASRMTAAPPDRARHSDALLLTAGELAGQVLGTMRHADLFERRHHPFLALGGSHAPIREGQLDVLVHVEIANQVEALEDEPDFAVANAGPLREREIRPPICRSAMYSPSVGESSKPRIDSSVDLPQPDGPAMEMYSPVLDLQVNPGERVRLDFVGEEDLGDAVEMDQRRRGRVHRDSF